MEEITVEIGELVTGNGGITNDTRQAVQFTGEELGSYREYGTDRYGKITDTRGTTQTLYRTADGGLVVHVYEWSRWVGEPDAEFLYAVTEESLQHGGLYDRLGAACGFGRPLTLAEAIGPRRPGAVVDVGELIESDRAGASAPAGRLTSSGVFLDIESNQERIAANRARLAVAMGGDDEELLDYSFVPFQMIAGMTALDVQHSIALFVSTLGAQRWRKGNATIERLLDALLGVLDNDYFAALENGYFDTPH